jgi:hypothetical protein
MSYDLEVRGDQVASASALLEDVAAIAGAVPGMQRRGRTSFVLHRSETGVHVNLDLGYQSGGDADGVVVDEVNVASLQVPYQFLEESGSIAVALAFQIADRFGWRVFDPQRDTTLFRDDVVHASAARSVPGPAMLSLMELFQQEMWNHSLFGVAGLLLAVVAIAAWTMIALAWPRERLEAAVPWVLSLGGVAALWLKGIVQAALRYRNMRRHAAPAARDA